MYFTKNFSAKELNCKCELCNGEVPHNIDLEALLMLQKLRDKLDRPLVLTSAYRCSNHPIEAAKNKVGTHNSCAFDIKASNGAEKMEIVKAALEIGFTGIGIAKSFVHLDARKSTPVIWSY